MRMLHSYDRDGRPPLGNEHRRTSNDHRTLEGILLDDSKNGRTMRIGTFTSLTICQALTTFIRNNRDVFAWSHENMPGIDPSVMVHRLNMSPTFTPICQKKKIFALERDQAITEKVHKLQEANFIKEVYYPDWLANVVMVKKSSEKWRMCIDFTDLNKACPKDSYPLSQVNVLVDFTAQHQLLSFMDTFSSYNQIRMDKADQEKTLFVTN